jgi:hypothetical protein
MLGATSARVALATRSCARQPVQLAAALVAVRSPADCPARTRKRNRRPTRLLHQSLSGLLASSLILGLDSPTSVTGDTRLCFGRLALLSPIKSTLSSPSLNVPVAAGWEDGFPRSLARVGESASHDARDHLGLDVDRAFHRRSCVAFSACPRKRTEPTPPTGYAC